MRIIGKTEEGWIFQGTRDELAKIVGHSSWHRLEQARERTPNVGDRIDVGKTWNHLTEVRRAAEALASAGNTLSEVAVLLKGVPEFLGGILEGEGEEDHPKTG